MTRVSALLDERRPNRADAARNFDALLGAARQVFLERGADVPLAEVATRAGVGIATLFRHFPTREDLVEAVYVTEVDTLCRDAEDLAATATPKEALDEWIRRFVTYMATKQVLLTALDRESGAFVACKAALYDAGGPLLDAAQADGSARDDVTIDDVMRFVVGVTSAPVRDDDQQARMVRLAVDAVAAHQ